VSSRRLVACTQNHDQIGNRAAGERLTQLVDEDLVRLSIVLLLAAPQTPMLFMGEEWGETRPFQFFTDMPGEELRQAIRDGRREEFAGFEAWSADDVPDPLDEATFLRSKLDRSQAGTASGRQRRALFADLLALRRSQPALGTGQRDLVHILKAENGHVFVRRDPPRDDGRSRRVLMAANLTDETAHVAPHPVLLSSGSERYGGPGHDPDVVPPRTAVLLTDVEIG
jgi:hypothetical protein